MLKQNNKIAIVVEGGGFKSAFSAGVLDSFIINNFDPFDIYVGVSGGAMNLTSYILMKIYLLHVSSRISHVVLAERTLAVLDPEMG